MEPPTKPNTSVDTCADCGQSFPLAERYALCCSVWRSVAKREERLHRACFEKRLGRPLTDADCLFGRRVEGDGVMAEVHNPDAYDVQERADLDEAKRPANKGTETA